MGDRQLPLLFNKT